MSKGDAEHAAQHVHGVVPRQEPPVPQTIEQRVSSIETLLALADKGKTVLEQQIEDLKARHAKAAEVPQTKAEIAAEKKEAATEAAQEKKDARADAAAEKKEEAAQDKRDAAAEKRNR